MGIFTKEKERMIAKGTEMVKDYRDRLIEAANGVDLDLFAATLLETRTFRLHLGYCEGTDPGFQEAIHQIVQVVDEARRHSHPTIRLEAERVWQAAIRS